MRRMLLNNTIALVVLISGSLGLSATVATPVGDLSIGVQSAEARGPIAGCPQAAVITIKPPVDGGAATRKLGSNFLWIGHLYWNNGHPSVQGKIWNPGVPPFRNNGQEQIKTNLGRGPLALNGAGGKLYRFVNNKACRHNLKFEFRNGNFRSIPAWKLIAWGLVVKL